MANMERLDRLVEWAAAQEDLRAAGLSSEWDQTEWIGKRFCGTVCCVAGKVALEDGHRPVNDLSYIITVDGRRMGVDTYAMDALGLNDDQADVLFEASNTLDDLRVIVEAIRAGVRRYENLMDLVENARKERER